MVYLDPVFKHQDYSWALIPETNDLELNTTYALSRKQIVLR